MPGLTRQEARERAQLLTVDGYDVDLDLTGSGPAFRSTTTIRFRTADPARPTWLDVTALHLRRVRVNGADVSREVFADDRLRLTGLRGSNEVVVDAVMAYSSDGEGLHRFVDPVDGKTYLYAMSWLTAAPRWFACFDQPDLKAPVRITVSCPPGWTVAGNSPASQAGSGAWVLPATRPLAPYFTTVLAGQYHSIHREHGGIRLGLHARASLAGQLERDAAELFAMTGAFLDEYQRLFGIPYPWGEYHQAFVPDFAVAGMEAPGCVLLRDPALFRGAATDLERSARASTIAHEMAHMWFGDLVTMRWWDDLWLSEAFAEYMARRLCSLLTRHRSWVDFGITRKWWGMTADRRPSTHPIARNGARSAADALHNFDGISYAKGASVLRQLVLQFGDEVFFAGLRNYLRDHAFANAEFADLRQAWTAAGAADLGQWAGQWLQTAGLDTLRVTGASLARETPPGPPADRAHAVVLACYDGDLSLRTRQPVLLRAPRASLPVSDPAIVLADVNDESWAKIALAPAAWQDIASLIPQLEPAARVSMWNALRLAVADAEVDPGMATGVVAAVIGSETLDSVFSSMLHWSGRVLGSYTGEPAAAAITSRLHEVCLGTMIASGAGSAMQLAAAKGAIATSVDPGQLRAWLTGKPPAGGMIADPELRWLIVERLAALGDLDRREISQEVARDLTSQGAVHGARCVALLPDPEAKARAWHALMTDAERPNYELYAIAEGFWHPLQRAVTAPFVRRYFDEVTELAAARSGWVLARLAELLYPWTAASEPTLRRTNELLGRDGLDPGIRRSVIDAGDDLRRAVASRGKFR